MPLLLPPERAISWYCGVTQYGKTHLALQHAGELVRQTGFPCLIIDSTQAAQFRSFPHARTVEECFDRLYATPRLHAVFTPHDEDEVERLIRGVQAARRVVVFIDESAFWFTGQKGRQGEILRAMRGWFHAELRFLLTTQHLSGDVPQEAWALGIKMHAFRQEAPAAWDVLQRRFGIHPDEVRNLGVGEYVEYPRKVVHIVPPAGQVGGVAPVVPVG